MTISSPSCNTSPLSAYNPSAGNPWNESKAKHVYRRLAAGAPKSVLNVAVQKGPQKLVSEIMTEAKNMPNYKTPVWAKWANKDFKNYHNDIKECKYEIRRQTIEHFLEKGLKGRLVLFWMNHFVTDIDTYTHAPYMFQYWDILQKYALGNFRDFVKAIGTTPAMLYSLDGFYNTKFKPNENYARELYELFTLGENNGYTQEDIKETARSLTGYNTQFDNGGKILFDVNKFDRGTKVIFNRIGYYRHNKVIDILFKKRGDLIAKFIARKLYKYFVCPDVNENIVDEMAKTLVKNDFEMAPMLEQLFKSQHFFDDSVIGTIIKSPYDLLCIFLNESGFSYKRDYNDRSVMETINYIHHVTTDLGQRIYKPIDVKGWQRDETWLNGSTIIFRMKALDDLIMRLRSYKKNQLLDFVRDLTNNSKDPAFISRTVVNHFLSKPLNTKADYDTVESVLKWQVPGNYYKLSKWSLDWNSAEYQVLMLFKHLLTIPEFQLK